MKHSTWNEENNFVKAYPKSEYADYKNIEIEIKICNDMKNSIINTQRLPVDRPSWDETWLNTVMLFSLRSPDAQTQHACAIVDSNNHLLGLGYNGFPPGIDDSILPNTRPEKYNFVLHSESNCIDNMSLKGNNLTAYITGTPCIECLKKMWSNGVKRIVYLDRQGTILESDDEYTKAYNTLQQLMVDKGLVIIIVPINTKWLTIANEKFSCVTAKSVV